MPGRLVGGGKLLLAATALALLWANVAHDAYSSVWNADASLAPDWLQLHLTLGDWVADGLLALFFFVVPLFAPAAAGVPLAVAGAAVADAIAVGVFAGLLAGIGYTVSLLIRGPLRKRQETR